MAVNLLDDLISIFNKESDKLKRHQEALKRPPRLRPIYYRVLLTTRPFGLALCKTFDEKYLCVVLPESPSGQLGLRAGSEIISINSFAQRSEVINLLNDEYPNQKQHNFIWMYQFPKVQYLQDNTVMPITLYLKYDPLVVLSETTDKIETKSDDNNKEESCNYWKILQDDVYRWAVQQISESWIVCERCNVYSMPPIQSPIIQHNIMQYYHNKFKKKAIQNRLNDIEDKTPLKSMSDFVIEDEHYKKIGEIETGMKLKVYSKAGAYVEIREPMNGWIKFKTEGKKEKEAKDHCIKCKEQNDNKCDDENVLDLKSMNKKKGDFTMFINKDYMEHLSGIEPIKRNKDNMDNLEYNVIDVINALNIGRNEKRVSVLYFMGDIDFGHTFDIQQKHLKQLMNLQNKYGEYANFIIIRVCCVNNVFKSEIADKLKIGNKEIDLNMFIYGKARMEILKMFGLLHYDTGFFKYGLMLLSKDNKIIIHPDESIDVKQNDNDNKNDIQLGVFEKVASYIVGNQ